MAFLILSIVSYVSATVVLVMAITAGVAWVKGIFPVLLRVGNGLAKRKIAIFAKNDNLVSLKSLLMDSGLFAKKNISEITANGDIGKAENRSVYLVFWPDWEENIDDILNSMKDGTALVVYAPRESGPVPEPVMKKINEKRNAAVTNFRGRLLNDITTSIITTSYK